MGIMSVDNLVKQLQWRYAVKKFDPKGKISEADWNALEASLVLCPSSYGLQPWQFLVVQSPDLRKKLTPVSWNQTQVEDCSHFVVFTAKNSLDEAYVDTYLEDISRTRGIPVESLAGYRKMMVGNLIQGDRSKVIDQWAARQAYIALGTLMTTAAMLGVDSCPMEGIVPAEYDKLLGLTGTGYVTVVACALGYRHPEDGYSKLAKVRFSREKMVKYL